MDQILPLTSFLIPSMLARGFRNYFDNKEYVLLKKIKECKKLYEYVSISYKLSETLKSLAQLEY